MIYRFINGIELAGYLVVALFFLQFWRRSKHALFGWFSLGFVVLGLQPAITGIFALSTEQQAKLFLIRFAGFLLIALGIGAANRNTSD